MLRIENSVIKKYESDINSTKFIRVKSALVFAPNLGVDLKKVVSNKFR